MKEENEKLAQGIHEGLKKIEEALLKMIEVIDKAEEKKAT